MAINLAEKYEKQLAQAYTHESLLSGKFNTEYSWNGVVSINVLTAVTQPLQDYKRTGTGRYGTAEELQDTKQTLTITQDKSFAMTIDKGNNDEQLFAKKTGTVVKSQIGEQVTPWFDKYNLGQWIKKAHAIQLAQLTKDTVLTPFVEARKYFVNHNIPLKDGQNYAYVPTSVYSMLLLNPEFISVEKLAAKHLSKGVVGKVMGFLVVETPDDYLGDVQILFTHKKSVLAPVKSKELHVHDNPPGISGRLIEGRYRGDAFVLDVYKDGVVKITKG